MVYIINQNGQPLMPTARHGFVRRMLKEKRAKIIRRCPFTIQLLYATGDVVQPVSLGVDAGSKHIGLSATTETKEIYAADVEIRNDIVKLQSARREFRRVRRNRKTRYRKPRFDNRVKSKYKGWLAPSIEAKIGSHIQVVQNVCKILPAARIVVEVASFDLQKLKADDAGLAAPKGAEYQQGEMLGFWNAREYVLFRDGHTCQCCKGKSGDKRLNVHHIQSRQIGGNAPNNLITLCETCHTKYHAGSVSLPKSIKRGKPQKDAVFMGIMRWTFYNRLQVLYPGMVSMTYGYITKNTRITNGIEKTHTADARCVSGNPKAEPADCVYFQRKVRCHNRQLHKATILKGGVRKRNQAAYAVFGYRLFDKVLYQNQTCFITGRRTSGSFKLVKFDGTILSEGVSYKKIKLLERARYFITERRAAFSPCLKAGVSAA